jgi:hypothetical protein
VKVYFPRRVVVVVLRFLPAPVVVVMVVLPSLNRVVVRVPLLVERIVVLPVVLLIQHLQGHVRSGLHMAVAGIPVLMPQITIGVTKLRRLAQAALRANSVSMKCYDATRRMRSLRAT